MKAILLSAAILSLSSVPVLAQQTPAEVLDLSCWKISLPIDAGDGRATTVEEKAIAEGFLDPENFYVNEDEDGVVFSSPIKGVLTSEKTTYTRSELHEMGRCGDTSITPDGPGVNKNNWVFSSAPEVDRLKASGVDGTMDAVLSVDEVTTTGAIWQQGRVIVGQIHANEDEPAKLYYRKMPNHVRGSVFLAHETNGGDETIYPLLGTNVPGYYTQDGEVVEPKDGIELGERWGYQLKVVGNQLTVTVRRDGKKDIVQIVDMSDSKYDVGGQHMHFKAGVYNQNKTGQPDERVTATFYELKVTHQNELLRDYKGDVSPPATLLKAYSQFVEATGAPTSENLRVLTLPHSVTISTAAREVNSEYGTDMNIPFLKTGFHKQILNLRKESEQCFLIRTGSSYIRYIKTASNEWKIYNFGDKPIQ